MMVCMCLAISSTFTSGYGFIRTFWNYCSLFASGGIRSLYFFRDCSSPREGRTDGSAELRGVLFQESECACPRQQLVVSPVIPVKHYTFARIQVVPLCVYIDSIDYLWCGCDL